MSSRGQFVGSGPVAGIYQPTPVPREEKDLPAYVNDELLSLGGRLNSVFEGGAFPPQSEMPKRWRDGMMIYFTQPLDDTYPTTGDKIITSSGIWLFKRGKWWKIIDDPTDIVGGLTYYCILPDNNPPTTPETGTSLPPISPGFTWEEIPPVKPDKSYWIFSTTVSGTVEDNGETSYSWSIPTIWSAGVVDGNTGAPGRDGSVWVTMEITGTAFDPQQAHDYILSTVGREIVEWDIVTQYNKAEDFSDTQRVSVIGNPGTWILFDNLIDGSVIINGTVHGDAVDAKTRIRIGDLSNPTGDLLVLDANSPDARIWVGSAAPDADAKFLVDPEGNMTCKDATINGVLDGVIGSKPGAELQGTAIRVPPTADQNSGFFVTSNGEMYCDSGNFRGTVQADKITGDVVGMRSYTQAGYLRASCNKNYNIATINTDSQPFTRELLISTVTTIRGDSGTDNSSVQARFRALLNGSVVYNGDIVRFQTRGGETGADSEHFFSVNIPANRTNQLVLQWWIDPVYYTSNRCAINYNAYDEKLVRPAVAFLAKPSSSLS